MPAFFQDIRYGLRTLVHNRGFTAVSIVTLALGIGANAAIFTLIDATLLQKPQAEDPERILSVYSGREDRPFSSASYPDYVDLRDRNESFSGFATYGRIGVTWNTGEQSETLGGYVVSGNYFSVLGLRPAAGRFFLAEEDDTPGSHPVVVLSHRLWTERFGSSPDVISNTMTLNGYGFTIVGVAPAGFTGRNMVESGDVWIPMMMQAVVRPPRAGFYGGRDPDLLERRGARWLDMFGRLRPDASPEEAAASLDVIGAQLADAYPESNARVRFTVYPAVQGDPRAREALVPAATLLMVVVGMVLLIACANVANLQLARAAARRVEIATRAALGAGRGRLMRQFLTESVLIAFAGAFAGVILAAWTTSLLVSTVLEANILPIRFAVEVDPFPSSRVLAFTLFVALATALIFGLAPAVQGARQNLTEALRGSDARRRFGLRKALVVSQVAMSLLLLICTGLFLKSLRNAATIDPGFETDNVLVMPVRVNLLSYSKEQGRQFYQRLIAETEALPGVESAALARVTALGGGGRRISVLIEGREPPPPDSPHIVGANVVSPGYLETLGIPLQSGQDFALADDEGAAPVCIINETMAQRFWPGENAVGKRLQNGPPESPMIEVIGIARDGKYVSLGEAPTPFVYFPLLQRHESGVTLHVRTASDPTAFIQPIQSRIRDLEPNLPVADVRTMSDQLHTALFPARMGASLTTVFGLVALLLASVGVYGVMTYSMAQRKHEFGIRMALGARASHIFRVVLGEAFALISIGVGLGLAAALLFTRPVESFLYGVSSRDPLAYVAVTAILIATALVAGFVPARRATEVDPVTALRYE